MAVEPTGVMKLGSFRCRLDVHLWKLPCLCYTSGSDLLDEADFTHVIVLMEESDVGASGAEMCLSPGPQDLT